MDADAAFGDLLHAVCERLRGLSVRYREDSVGGRGETPSTSCSYPPCHLPLVVFGPHEDRQSGLYLVENH